MNKKNENWTLHITFKSLKEATKAAKTLSEQKPLEWIIRKGNAWKGHRV